MATPLESINSDVHGFGSATGVETARSLPEVVGSIIGNFLGLLGMVFVVLIIYGGYTWMTAQGNEEKVTKAKKIITSAVIGMIIIFLAYAIADFVIGALITATA